MGQEFVIKSQDIEDKINQLLPSQGGFAPGVDFSASTTIIPIVDLTETAEGSQVRQDLQTAFSHANTTHNSIRNQTTDMINTPGFYRIFGVSAMIVSSLGVGSTILINDGATDKTIYQHSGPPSASTDVAMVQSFDFIVKVNAGETVRGVSSGSSVILTPTTRQIADINGNLTSA